MRTYQGDTLCRCGKELPIYLTGGGMLTGSCGWCREQIHSPSGSASFRKLKASLKLANLENEPAPQPAPEVIAKPAPATKPKQTPQVEKTIFDIFSPAKPA